MPFLSVLSSFVTVRFRSASVLVFIGFFLSGCSSPLKYDARSGYSPGKHSAQCKPYYRVVSGDTLSDIAEHCQVSMQPLAKANDLHPPYFIYVNQELGMPGMNNGVVHSQRTDSHPKRASNTAVSQPKPTVKSSKWQWPMQAKIDHRFIRDSAGLSVLEMYGLPGQAVASVAPGNVVYAGDGIVNYGWMIVIKHDDDYMSIYAHNRSLLVEEGDRVKRGQQIATLGATGNTAKPKLYLEARYQGRKIDIRKVLQK
jgi:murein DD-endopeptidase MepM/ murein hydrolase activator NlpD